MEGHQRFAGLAASPARLHPASTRRNQSAQRQGQQGQEQGQHRPASAASLAISSDGVYDDASPGASMGGGYGLPNALFDASLPASPQVHLRTAGAQLLPQALPSQPPASAAAPVSSTAASLDTLGSGFGGGQADADEVLQFLRGSIAAPSGGAVAVPSAMARAPVLPPSAGSRLRQSSAAVPPAAFAPRASLDLQAILDSRPASPAKAPETRDSSGGGSDAAAQARMEHCAAEPAAADLQLLRISARPRSPSPVGAPAAGSPALTLVATEVVSPGSAWGGSVTPVLQDTFPADALQRLEALKARLSPSATPPGRRSTSPGGPAAWQAGLGSGSSSCGTRSKSCCGEDGSAATACPLPSSQPAHCVLPPLRCDSPDLGDGLPRGLTRRGARLLQSAVGRMAGNPGEGADAADIQSALMDVLQQHSEEVQVCLGLEGTAARLHAGAWCDSPARAPAPPSQAHYQDAAAERLEGLRREFCHDVGLLQHVLEREGAVLVAAQEAAIRRELAAFVDGCLPALADVLASKRLLLRCFELLAEQEETEGED